MFTFYTHGNGGLQRSRDWHWAPGWVVPAWGDEARDHAGRGLSGEQETMETRALGSRPAPENRARDGRVDITCCGGRRSAFARCARTPGPAVPEVAVGPPAGSPRRPGPIGAVDGPEEAGGA